jgi:hypothetical protein
MQEEECRMGGRGIGAGGEMAQVSFHSYILYGVTKPVTPVTNRVTQVKKPRGDAMDPSNFATQRQRLDSLNQLSLLRFHALFLRIRPDR